MIMIYAWLMAGQYFATLHPTLVYAYLLKDEQDHKNNDKVIKLHLESTIITIILYSTYKNCNICSQHFTI